MIFASTLAINSVLTSDHNPSSRDESDESRSEVLLQKVVERVSNQTPLRLLNCLQIATKMLHHSKVRN